MISMQTIGKCGWPRVLGQWNWRIICVIAICVTADVSHWPNIKASTIWAADSQLGSVGTTILAAEAKTVKIFGAGGAGGLDAFQSGFFISEQGHILTVWSTVLDVEEVVVITSDGQRNEAVVVGIDPNLEIAILQTKQPSNAFFKLDETTQGNVGERVLAISNLFGIATGREMSSVQKGVIMARTRLDARRGTFSSVYQGPVYVVDAMTNNPGAAGGALTDFDGHLLGMLGKELRDAGANIWLNYAIPIEQLTASVKKIMEGKSIASEQATRKPKDRPHTLVGLGIILIPDVLAKTPAYIDTVLPNSRASQAGLEIDDLILFVNSVRITSQAMLRDELSYIDRGDRITILAQRGNELKDFQLNGE